METMAINEQYRGVISAAEVSLLSGTLLGRASQVQPPRMHSLQDPRVISVRESEAALAKLNEHDRKL